MRKGKGKGLIWHLFVPSCDWLSILAGHSPCVQAWGAGTNSVFASLSNRTVGLEWISGTVSCIKFAKALGLTIGHSPEELNEAILSCQTVGCIKR